MSRATLWIVIALVTSCLISESVEAQPQTQNGPSAQEAGVGVEADPTTPRGAMYLYLVASREGDFDAAAGFLDLSGVAAEERASRGRRIARQLKIVLDQTLWIDFSLLSALPSGELEDGLAAGRDRVGVIQSERGDVQLSMVRQGDGTWRFAPSLVAQVPRLYEEFGYGWLGERLPSGLFSGEFLEIQPWQWIGLALAFVLAVLLGWILSRVSIWAMRPFVRRTRGSFDDKLLATARAPLALLFAVSVFYGSAQTLKLALPPAQMVAALCQLLTLLAVTWVIFRAVDIGAEALAERAQIRGHQGLASVLPLARVTFKTALGLLALIVGLQNFGVNVTGLLAGLGFGGLAFALASQKTLENLFGGVTVIADQPVRVGDFCRFGDRVGTVEDIGLRSTRVRTVERTVITVPNGEFATMQLENFAKRDSIRFSPRLGLRYETTPDQMRYALVEMRRLLYSHPMVDPEGARVRFAGFGESSLDVDIAAYIRVTDWAKYLEVAEDLNLRLMDVVDAAGSGFAFPSQTLYVSHDDGLDSERSKAAERSVAEWRERGELAHPDFSPEALRSIAGTTTFPEAGSQAAGLGTKTGPSGDPAEE